MVNLTTTDINKMRVVDLRKELKSRGLPCSGDKAELVIRLQAAISEENPEANLDSLEIDSDGVLDEDDKSHNDLLEDTVDTLNEELALADQLPATGNDADDSKPLRTHKRKITLSDTDQDKIIDNIKTEETKDSGTKKIVLNRAISVTAASKAVEEKTDDKPVIINSHNDTNKVRIPTNLDSKTKLELRAKRFGLPVKMTDAERREARKNRFGQSTISGIHTTTASKTENIDKLKKRAERFGQSVSKVMTDIENKEKLEKRKAKFGSAK